MNWNHKKVFGISIATFVILGLVFSALEKIIDWIHWYSIEFNMLSFSPWLIPVSWGSWLVYIIVTFSKKPYWYYYVMGALWGLSEAVWTAGMIWTWFL